MEIYGMTGEKLGTIGDHGKDNGNGDDTLAPWQREFLSKPSVSIRQGIAWRYQPPYEDTDTVVLTAPSSRFIDIRLPKKLDSDKSLAEHPAFWAITGSSSATFPGTDASPMVHVAHGRWEHDIDSKSIGTKAQADEGDMFVLENGDVAEVGFMTNPHTGQQDMYKEYWTSRSPGANGEPVPARLRPCVVAELVDSSGSSSSSSSSSSSAARGLAIQLGSYFQAILLSTHASEPAVLAVERWINDSNSHHWSRDPRSGIANVAPVAASASSQQQHGDVDASLVAMLCPWLTQAGRQEGDEYGTGAYRWRVTEVLRES